MNLNAHDFEYERRRRQLSNSQPLSKGWCRFFGWSGSIIFCGVIWGLLLHKVFGK